MGRSCILSNSETSILAVKPHNHNIHIFHLQFTNTSINNTDLCVYLCIEVSLLLRIQAQPKNGIANNPCEVYYTISICLQKMKNICLVL